jgi:hypothetical protein
VIGLLTRNLQVVAIVVGVLLTGLGIWMLTGRALTVPNLAARTAPRRW